MLTIYKYSFKVDDTVSLVIPKDAKILHLANTDAREVTLWALVELDAPKEPRVFYVRGTGHPVQEDIKDLYLGTVQDGMYVWHIFGGRA